MHIPKSITLSHILQKFRKNKKIIIGVVSCALFAVGGIIAWCLPYSHSTISGILAQAEVAVGFAGDGGATDIAVATATPKPISSKTSVPTPDLPTQLKQLQDETSQLEQRISNQEQQVAADHEANQNLADELKATVVTLTKTNTLLNEQGILPSTGNATTSGATISTTNKVNINSAGLTQLEELPSIGASYAQRIIDYRTQKGPFTKIEDIENISGIKDAIFSKIKELIEV